MRLISVEGWPYMLWANVDTESNMWFEPSTIGPPELLHTYTLEELLKEWKPTRSH